MQTNKPDTPLIDQFVRKHKLPASYATWAQHYFLPLAGWMFNRWQQYGARVIGINGAQGTGKSTLAALLETLLTKRFGLRVVRVSIDDFYLSRDTRARLGENIHPLLATRGVPGTHDTALGIQVFRQLLTLKPGEQVQIPRFIKALDDHSPRHEWPVAQGPVDLVLFEGWCVGSQPQAEGELIDPVNTLEAQHDGEGIWRRHANEQLAAGYATWFAMLDQLIFLMAPDFECVFKWRLAQEQDNARGFAGEKSHLMDEREIRFFVQHYERLTRANLARLPRSANVLIRLNDAHGVDELSYLRGAT